MNNESEEVFLTAEQVAKFSTPFHEGFKSSNRRNIVNTSLATKPASVMRTYTQQVRDHTAARSRLQDQYFAALKRAEAQYFEGVKRITDAVTQSTEPVAAEPVADTAVAPPTQQ
jgi:hypothetical protein